MLSTTVGMAHHAVHHMAHLMNQLVHHIQSFLLTVNAKQIMEKAGGVDGDWGKGTTKALQTFLAM